MPNPKPRIVHVVYTETGGPIDPGNIVIEFSEIAALRKAVRIGGKAVPVQSGQSLAEAITNYEQPKAPAPKIRKTPEPKPEAEPAKA